MMMAIQPQTQPTRERRTMTVDRLEVRAEEGQAPKIIGHAALFDSPSKPIFGVFVEVIKPGAFDRAIRENQDVRALFNHDGNFVLGRTASGTLRLSVDAQGLGIEIDPPDTSFARDLQVSIQRGDVSQMSFAFRVKSETFIDGGGTDGLDLREINDLDLFDVSPVTFPAYDQTDVAVRSHESWKGERHARPQSPSPLRVLRQRQSESELI